MLNQAEAVSGERVFRRNPLRSAVGAIVLSAVLSAVTLFVLPKFLPRTMNISTRGVLVLVLASALTVAVFAGFFWFRNIRIVIRPDAVEIGKAGNRETFLRATTAFRSKITEHRTNGLPSGTTRALIVHTGDREITIELPGYSRPLFNELMATLNPIALPVFDDPVAAARAGAQLPTQFTIDATGERRLATRITVAAVVFLVIAIGVGLLVAVPGFVDSELSALILLAPFAAVAAIGFGIGAVQRRRLVRSIPAQVSVDSQGIRIDGVDTPYAQLARIWLTPPAYPVKRLRFDRAAGKTTTHLLASSRVGIAPDYGDLLLAVRARTAHLPGLLSLDLE
ncbi:hypothetical protein ASD13_15950 [Microbacterium sp. Root1433D1]|uniref:hypothetical protein n=1 Tax=Microbacterium sp. Root1433D1 TaxID=1736463 RepID=UPI0006FBA5C7|nr:hypothetical protein [Microbacterium sp. Root1433D1]KQY73624.1 hypothetical protein ASD13_15950 [Microbacterium sp. Root1433D1]